MTAAAKKVYTDIVDALAKDALARRKSLDEGEFGADTADTILIDSLTKISEAFSRSEISDEYVEKEGEGMIGAERRSLFLQNDFVAGFEKASTSRFRGRIANLTYGAARDAGQAQALGYIELALRQAPLTQGGGGEAASE